MTSSEEATVKDSAIAQSPRFAAACPNCGHATSRTYCGECGQRRHDGGLTLGHLTREMFEELVSVDGRVFSTLRLLYTRPGQLTLDFLEGRRARHLSPLRLFLVIFALFFVFSMEVVDIRPSLTLFRAETDARAAAHGLTFDAYVERLNGPYQTGVKAMRAALLVLTSLWYLLFFRRFRPALLDHVVMALHLACFSLSVGMVGNLVTRATGFVPINVLFAVPITMVYATLAARRVYGTSLASAGWRVVVITVANLVIGSIVVLGIARGLLLFG